MNMQGVIPREQSTPPIPPITNLLLLKNSSNPLVLHGTTAHRIAIDNPPPLHHYHFEKKLDLILRENSTLY